MRAKGAYLGIYSLLAVLTSILIGSCSPAFRLLDGGEREADLKWQRKEALELKQEGLAERRFRDLLRSEHGAKAAYDRLVEVLSAELKHRKARFITPAIRTALSDPLFLEALAWDLTNLAIDTREGDQTGDISGKSPDEIVFSLTDLKLESENGLPASGFRGKRPDDILFSLTETAQRGLGLPLGEERRDDVLDVPRLDVQDGRGAGPSNALEGLIQMVQESEQRIREAYSSMGEGEESLLLKDGPRILDRFIFDNRLTGCEDERLLQLAAKIQWSTLFQALEFVVAVLLSEDLLDELRVMRRYGEERVVDIEPGDGFEGEFLMARRTPVGLFLVGGRGTNVYGSDAAVIIDLGGDDVYLNNTGSPVYEMREGVIRGISSRLGIVLDLDGNDRYSSTRFGSLGSGFAGVGVLIDMDGDDLYSGDRLTQGAGYFGIGCLIDLRGNDTYAALEAAQGAALFGAGFLLDRSGNDVYNAAKWAQGFGGPLAGGFLLDLQGEDRYHAGGKHPSSYGTPNILQAMSQGVGWGFRKKAAGGLGILYDCEGNDRYSSGNFAQGTGYYFGTGILRDDCGDDRYRASRYSQGSAAHQACGILVDMSGDDEYLGDVAANQGAAWDVSVAGLFDYEGNDRYRGADLSLGAAAQNGMAMFYDGGGKDTYEAGRNALGFSGPHTYHGGRDAGNLGLFLDVGEESDAYPPWNDGNNRRIVRGDVGVFVDE